MRILPLIPENAQLTPIQLAVLNVIEGLDGVGGIEHETIIDNSVEAINEVIHGK